MPVRFPSRRPFGHCVLLALGAVLACNESTAPPPPIIARVQITASRTSLATGDTVTAIATAYDSSNNVVRGAQFTWSSDDATLATVDGKGVVQALRAGTVQVRATAAGPAESVKSVVSGTLGFDLRQVVARIVVTTLPVTVATGDTVQVAAKAFDALDVEVPQAGFVWSSSDSLVAIVASSSGTLIGRAIGRATVTAHATEPGSTVQGSSITSVRLVLAQLAGGMYHNCGVARGGVVHCWGEGAWGRLGTGIAYDAWKSVTVPVAALVADRFTSVDEGDEQQDSRSGHTCARSTSGKAYCWGSGAWGMLADGRHGEGLPPYENAFPTALTGVASVKQIGTGAMHTCLLDGAGAAYCSGSNSSMQVGAEPVADICDGGPCATRLVPVNGGHVFASLAVGGYHACGLTTAGDAWCWGDGGFGQLGGTLTSGYSTATPILASGVQFKSITAGEIQTCGLDAGGVAYCWGDGWFGQLGNGQSSGSARRTTPTRVTTLQTFASIYAGIQHTCALTGDGIAYCWGDNADGQLGFATTAMCGDPGPNSVVDPCATTPQAVNTALRFVSLALGMNHSCGLTSAGEAYCWGGNERGQLGDGTIRSRIEPAKVADTK